MVHVVLGLSLEEPTSTSSRQQTFNQLTSSGSSGMARTGEPAAALQWSSGTRRMQTNRCTNSGFLTTLAMLLGTCTSFCTMVLRSTEVDTIKKVSR